MLRSAFEGMLSVQHLGACAPSSALGGMCSVQHWGACAPFSIWRHVLRSALGGMCSVQHLKACSPFSIGGHAASSALEGMCSVQHLEACSPFSTWGHAFSSAFGASWLLWPGSKILVASAHGHAHSWHTQTWVFLFEKRVQPCLSQPLTVSDMR